MPSVVGVVFRNSGKVYHFLTDNPELAFGDNVIVETVRGTEIARVVTSVKEVVEEEICGEPKKVLRVASAEDIAAKYRNRLLAYRALKICKRKVRRHKLDMKLVDVEYSLDGTKIIFYFSAEGRVDFRNLVRDLATIFKKRIELHQIGVRDEAKMLGGIGPCGRVVCCHSFMQEFAPVSIKMAKDQNLSLNPERISGSCGRFMCCLKHEHSIYHAALHTYPPLNSVVSTSQGDARVIEHYVAKDAILVENQLNGRFEVKISELFKPDDEVQAQKQVSESLQIASENDSSELSSQRDKLPAKQGKKQSSRVKPNSEEHSDHRKKIDNTPSPREKIQSQKREGKNNHLSKKQSAELRENLSLPLEERQQEPSKPKKRYRNNRKKSRRTTEQNGIEVQGKSNSEGDKI